MAVSLLLSCQSPADGIAVAKRTRGGAPLRFRESSVLLRPSPEVAGGRPNPQMVRSLKRAAALWNEALSSCGAVPKLRVASAPLKRSRIRDDAINEVLFHEREWCPPGAMDDYGCYDPTVHASTHLRPELRPGHADDGVLREADLEINGVHFRWSPGGEAPGTLGLEAILVHELGHMLGLDHPCAPRGSRRRESGAVSALCDDRRVQRAVMHPNAAELLRRRAVKPLAAETRMICELYTRQR